MKHLLSLLIVFALLVFAPAVLAEDSAQITVSLDCNPSTGYVWTVLPADDTVAAVEDLGFAPFSSEEGLVGAPGVSEFRLCGLKEGTTEVTFTYGRPTVSSDTDLVFSLPVCVDAALNLSVDGVLELPCEEGSDHFWYVSTRASIVEFSVLDSEKNLRISVIPSADGEDTLHFSYNNEQQTDKKWDIYWDASVQGETVTLNNMSFRFPGMRPAAALTFTTTDFDGNTVTEQIFSGYKLTVLNFWEPWCGPCVNEMPFLQKLSEEYASRSVQVIGIYATPDSEDDVAAVLAHTGVTYPILHYVNDFDLFQTGYVPTNVIIDSSGNVVHGPSSGALNYAGWCALIEDLL